MPGLLLIAFFFHDAMAADEARTLIRHRVAAGNAVREECVTIEEDESGAEAASIDEDAVDERRPWLRADTRWFTVREKHAPPCAGDPATAPLVAHYAFDPVSGELWEWSMDGRYRRIGTAR
ncbi:MAG: hypothetical protein HY749_12300 [Gammaproteobacteria bacterium]|nr:hypothetical protein [Gammaproteobacteria bacterium]